MPFIRRRTIRDFGTIIGVGVILAGVVFVNAQWNRTGKYEHFWAVREQVESERETGGLELLKWPVMQETKGTRSSGPTYAEQLLQHKSQRVDIVGYMVPLYEFRNATEFLLLPVPLECYFCQMPPMRDVVYVRMAEGEVAQMVDEPVLINGELELFDGEEETEFFYVIKEAAWGPGVQGMKMTPKNTPQEHRIPKHIKQEIESPELLPGMELPSSGS